MADHPGSALLTLPKELLARVRFHLHSLEDHVNFSLTCKTTYDLYDDAFWRFACVSSGWTLRKPSSKTTKAMKNRNPSLFSGLARVIVSDATIFAAYSDMKYSIKDETIFEGSFPTFAMPQEKPAATKLTVVKHAFLNCDWNKKIVDMFTIPNYDDDAFDWENAPNLFHHPFVSHRLITTPPVTSLIVQDGKDRLDAEVKSNYGVTVYDTHYALAGLLRKLPKGYRNNASHSFFEGFQVYGKVLDACWGS